MNNQLFLKGQTLQVIVRLANIVLSPERPEYPGGEVARRRLVAVTLRGGVRTEFVKLQGS